MGCWRETDHYLVRPRRCPPVVTDDRRDVSKPPAQITNPKGKIYLRKGGKTLMDKPLAQGFEVSLGEYEITVPDVAGGEEGGVGRFGERFHCSSNTVCYYGSRSVLTEYE